LFGHPVLVKADGGVLVTTVSCMHADGPEPSVDGVVARRQMVAGFKVSLDITGRRGPVQQLACSPCDAFLDSGTGPSLAEQIENAAMARQRLS
jgi:hypothetical protein